ncbi:MAG: 50S ribosomal protein L10 [Actinobacteria bacterium]|nr:50S ribosomal protein L10 [Actinomycetota bacterium]
MARPEKVAVVDEIRAKLGEADAAILTEYRGLTVTELAQLRGALRPASTEYKVFKNTLARRAADEAGLADLSDLLEGPTAIAFVKGDAVAAAKAIREFGKAAPALVVKGGLLGTRILSPKDIEALADIEPREVLLARLAGGFQAPLVKAAGLFQAFTRNFAYGLKAYVDQRVEAGEALPVAAAPEATDDPPAEDTDAPAAESTDAPAAEATEEAPAADAEETPAAAADAADEAPAADAEAD